MRSEGVSAGSIGRFTGVKLEGRDYDAAPLSLTIKRIISVASDLKTRLTSITPPERFTEAGEFSQLVEDLDGNKIFSEVATIIPVHDDTVMKERAKQSDLMKVHTLFSDRIKKLNTLLFKYYRNDKRVQEIVLPYINLLNHGINAVNDAYMANKEKDLTGADSGLRKLTDEFGTLLTRWIYELFHGDMDVKQYRTMVKTLTSLNGEVMKEADKVITNVMSED